MNVDGAIGRGRVVEPKLNVWEGEPDTRSNPALEGGRRAAIARRGEAVGDAVAVEVDVGVDVDVDVGRGVCEAVGGGVAVTVGVGDNVAVGTDVGRAVGVGVGGSVGAAGIGTIWSSVQATIETARAEANNVDNVNLAKSIGFGNFIQPSPYFPDNVRS